jgi:hypothetical protein
VIRNISTQSLNFVLKWAAAPLVAWALTLPAGPAHAQNKFVMDENQFTGWLYQGSAQNPDEESEVTLMVDSIDRTAHLTAEQKEKLRLAGHGDYARFEQKVNDLRNECIGKTYDQNETQELYQKFQLLRNELQAGMLGSTSLFAKVVHRVLTPEQQEEYEAADAERRKASHAAKVRLFVAILEQSCPMKASQRDAFVELLLKETQPALRPSEYDWFVVIVQAAKIPDSKLAPILDPKQLAYIKKLTGARVGMEPMLRNMGVLPRN